MPTTCEFQLDRLNATYCSGEYINGRIILITTKPKHVNSVYVILEGEARVQWSLSNKSDAANYCGSQQYLNTRTTVFEARYFPAGNHVYAILLRIPQDCPSSCAAAYGIISYRLSVTLDKPWSFNEIFHKTIIVQQRLNLNVNPEFALPVKDDTVKYFCRWPCISGPISSTLALPYTGFVPSQLIPFSLEVDNQSPHYDINGIEVILRQHFIFLARKPFKRNFFTKPLEHSMITERTLRLTKRLYEHTICVPADTPRSTLNTQYIICVHYTLLVKIKTGQFHYDSQISVPIVIGTEPIQLENGVIRMQPTSNGVQTRDMSTLAEASSSSDDADDIDNENGTHKRLKEDKPPSYDSCLPPSFSYATLSSQQTIDNCYQKQKQKQNHKQKQHSHQPLATTSTVTSQQRNTQRIRINLPQFPVLNTFVQPSTSHGSSRDSILGSNTSHRSYGSLNTVPLGSLETFCTSCEDIFSESDENIFEDRRQNERTNDVRADSVSIYDRRTGDMRNICGRAINVSVNRANGDMPSANATITETNANPTITETNANPTITETNANARIEMARAQLKQTRNVRHSVDDYDHDDNDDDDDDDDDDNNDNDDDDDDDFFVVSDDEHYNNEVAAANISGNNAVEDDLCSVSVD